MSPGTEPELLTPEDLNLNYSSPGNVIRYGDQWLLGTQTYPRPVDDPGANQNARIFKMASEDLEHWGEPELLRVKGPHVPVSEMGRMIDAYFFPDKDHPHKWWCGFKQNGMGLSYTYDFETWTYYDKVVAGENVCVLVDREADEYVLIHAPAQRRRYQALRKPPAMARLGYMDAGAEQRMAVGAGAPVGRTRAGLAGGAGRGQIRAVLSRLDGRRRAGAGDARRVQPGAGLER